MSEKEERKVIATSPDITEEEEKKRIEKLVDGLLHFLRKRKTA